MIEAEGFYELEKRIMLLMRDEMRGDLEKPNSVHRPS